MWLSGVRIWLCRESGPILIPGMGIPDCPEGGKKKKKKKKEMSMASKKYTSKTTNNLKKKEIRFVVIRRGVWEAGELDEGSQKVQTFSCKRNKY